MAQFISWNCHGLVHKIDDIKSLLFQYMPACIAFQETYLQPSQNPKFHHYNLIRKDHDSQVKVSGGVALLVSHNHPFVSVNLKTTLQAIAVRIQVCKLITICTVYLPPKDPVTQKALSDLIEQLPAPFIILGDFNGHSPLWGNSDCNQRGELVESLISDFSLCLLNNGDSTYFHQPTKRFYAIDLAISTPSLVPLFNFWVSNDLHNSDHFPILLSATTQPNINANRSIRRHIHDKADWASFTHLAKITKDMIQGEVNTALNQITSTILKAANATIPQTSGTRKNRKPWWNQECQDAKKKQRKAWDIFRRYPTTKNLINF